VNLHPSGAKPSIKSGTERPEAAAYWSAMRGDVPT